MKYTRQYAPALPLKPLAKPLKPPSSQLKTPSTQLKPPPPKPLWPLSPPYAKPLTQLKPPYAKPGRKERNDLGLDHCGFVVLVAGTLDRPALCDPGPRHPLFYSFAVEADTTQGQRPSLSSNRDGTLPLSEGGLMRLVISILIA